MARTSTSAKKADAKPAKTTAKKTTAAKATATTAKRAPRKAAPKGTVGTLGARPAKTLTEDQRLNALEQRVEVLESERPGRKPMPLLAIRQRGVCAVDPSSDSAVCPFASIYRYQSGCHGTKCRAKQHEAYERRKGNHRGAAEPTKKTVAKKAPVTKKTVTKRVAPAKVVSKRATKQTAAA